MTNACPKKFASTLPEPRFQRYLDYAEECSSNPSDNQTEIAVQFYAWNTALSAAFYEPLQALEIALRNAVHKQMTNAFGKAWYNNLPKDKLNKSQGRDKGKEDQIEITFSKIENVKEKLDSEIEVLEKKIARLKKKKKEFGKKTEELQKKKEESYIADYMVTNLDLGFWVNLFYYKYLWKRGLKQVFSPENLKKGEIHDRLKKINKLRNRIAHHEPIFDRNLEKDMQDILEILGWICPITRDWVKEHNRFDEVMKNCPIKRQ